MAEKTQLWQMWYTLPFTKLLQSFKMTIRPTRLLIAMTALLAICLVGWIMDAYTMTVVTNPKYKATDAPLYTLRAGDALTNANELEVYLTEPEKTQSFINSHAQRGKARGVFSTLWNFGAARFNRATVSLLKRDLASVSTNIGLCTKALVWAVKYHTIYSIIYFTIAAAVFSLAGGAICRSAALELARGERPGLAEVTIFSIKRFGALLTAPALSLAMILFFAMFVFALGLMGNLPAGIGELIVALGLGAALIFAMVTVLLLIGTIAGACLMFPVIAYEGSDGFDAISRSFSYIFLQPWWMIFYSAVAIVYGTVSYVFVRFLAFLLLIVTYKLLDFGIFNKADTIDKLAAIWPKPEFFNLLGITNAAPANWSEIIAAFLIHMTVLFVVGLVVAFVISFYYCTGTIIYALMRRNVDDVNMDKIYVKLDEIRNKEQSPHQNTSQQG